ncbi:hypothetical protein B0H14DRAFT_2615085 [Mycena olivaceomarginata]|nr:hypothetical protein B0H14DRAFT_2615085 [Mycena olivaceomarginata]
MSDAAINALGQCLGCGNTSARLSTEYCGLCEKKNQRRVQNTNLSGAPSVATSEQQAPNLFTSVRNIGQFHRAQRKDAANFNGSSVKAQQSTVAINAANMATLKSNNLATNECYVFVLEPFVNSKACEFLPTFEVIREAAIKFSEIVANGIASFNSSWEDASESSLVRHETFPYEQFPRSDRSSTAPGLFRPKKRIWTENSSISLGSSVLKRTGIASAGPHSLKSLFALASLASTATPVRLFFAEHTSDPETGVQSFNWCTDDPNQ